MKKGGTALMAVCFVGTALTTVRRASRWARVINVAALTVATGLAFVSIVGGVTAVNSPGLSSGGVPFRTIGVMSFILAAGPMRALPIPLLFGGMFYWMWRVRVPRAASE